MPREKSIDNAILAWLNSLDGCLARKMHGGEFSVKGDPDIFGCYRGRMFQIENKRPGEEPEPIQLARLRQWARAGAKVGVAHSLAEAKELLEPWMRAIDNSLQ